MSLEINDGMERIIAAFEDGWASGAMLGLREVPSALEPSLHDFWLDGFEAAIVERSIDDISLTVH
ncbi:hypothetical protein [Sphingomonas crocodyli]|uniref:Uncharacterized protein n=1 Tax=Sphingomonas crocodyli TaxID=1979270 RepID=A0A437LXS7_9SPHN|nr:hypothetical protein [Sphingomonas crocodyli]RVT90123.1 hypothetical protein EOD43_17590 [Sphingomonas crocodyli]